MAHNTNMGASKPIAVRDDNNVADLTASAVKLRTITPHDTNELTLGMCRAVYVGTGGDLTVIVRDDTDAVPMTNIPSGSVVPIMARIVKSTGTTATGLVALY